MNFSFNTREKLIAYALGDFLLRYNIVKKDDMSFDNIMTDEILHEAHYCIKSQLDKNGSKLVNSNLNKLIHFTLLNLKLTSVSHTNARKKLVRVLKCNDVGTEYEVNKIVKTRSKDTRIIELCLMYLDLFGTKQTNKGDFEDNSIASDKFLFEKVIKRVAIDMYGKSSVKQKIKGIEDIGQSLTADTIISTGCNTILIDAKFYTSDLLYKHKNSDKVTYRHQNNRFQMNAYMDELKYNGYKNIVGVVVHAVDEERQEKFDCIKGHSMNIADNKIILEMVRIDVSFEEIIQQIKDMITKYTEL